MDFTPTDLQSLLRETCSRIFREHFDFGALGAARNRRETMPAPLLETIAENGFGGLTIAADAGGFGGGAIESGIVMEVAGSCAIAEPLLSGMLAAARVVDLCAPEREAVGLRDALLAGELPLALAGLHPAPLALTIDRAGDALTLNGRLPLIPGLLGARHLVILAHASEVIALNLGSEGIRLEPARRLDGVWCHDVALENVGATSWGHHAASVETIRSHGLTDLCWNALGSMQAATDRTAAYVKERQQFGRPLVKFQAIEHRLGEMYALLEEVRAIAVIASLALADAVQFDAPRLTSALKVKAGRAARYIAREAVQLHGGMGMSEELPIANHFRHLTAFEAQLGTTAEHRRRYGHQVLDAGTHRRSAVLPYLTEQTL